MRKIYLVTLTGLVFFFFSCGKSQSSFHIHSDGASWDKKGYDDIDPKKNGEYAVLKHFLKPNGIIIDVGANYGDWSKMVAKTQPTSTIYALEPQPSTYEILKNQSMSCTFNPINIALSDKQSELPFYVYGQDEIFSTLSGLYHRPKVDDHFKRSPEKISVKTDTLAHFCEIEDIESIQFLKIDTEGAECEILMGAQELIEQQRIDMIQFEYGGTYIDANHTLKEIYKLLTDNEYKVYRIYQRGLIHIPNWRDELETYQYSNYLSIKSTLKLQ